jgi:hypothetical protein
MKYPTQPKTIRPYRLWNAQEKKPVLYRYYKHRTNAHHGALIDARWAKVGTTIEVYNAQTGNLVGQYTRRVHTITFSGA